MSKRVSDLKLELVKRRLSQLDIAEAADINAVRFNRILNRRAEPREFELKNIARALGIPRDELPV